MTDDHTEEKREKAHESDDEAAQKYALPTESSYPDDEACIRREAFLTGAAHARKDQESVMNELRTLREFRDEVARDPYFDSDPASLLKTIQTRARVLRVMEKI